MNSYAAGGAMRRREEILRIVGQAAVHSQDELLLALRKRGLRVTQPTLSRDVRELGLLKGPAGYTSPEAIAPGPGIRSSREHRFEQLVRESVISAETAANLVVLKTPPAAAQPVASAVARASKAPVLALLMNIPALLSATRQRLRCATSRRQSIASGEEISRSLDPSQTRRARPQSDACDFAA